ncbi:MAG: hypothetical protein ACOX7W_01265 [Christensenellales bacterium]|jgi:hypothetical protein
MSDRRTQLLFRPGTGMSRPGSGHGYIITSANGWIITGVIRLPGVTGRLAARAGWGPSEDFKTLWIPLTRVDAGGVWNLSGRGIGPSPGIIWITADDRLLLLAGTVDSQHWRQKATEIVFYAKQKTAAPPLSPITDLQSPAQKPAASGPRSGRGSEPPAVKIDETPPNDVSTAPGKTVDAKKEEERQPAAMLPPAEKEERPEEAADEKPTSSVTPPGVQQQAVREEAPDEAEAPAVATSAREEAPDEPETPDAASVSREQDGEPESAGEPSPGDEKEEPGAKAPMSRAPLNRGQPATLAAEPAPQASLPRESEPAPLPSAAAPDTIPELMRTCPEDTPFIGLLPGARFARVPVPGGQEYDHYIVGHIPIGEQGFYLVGVPGPAGWQPPAGLSQFMHYLPGRMGGGYWVRYLVPEGEWK